MAHRIRTATALLLVAALVASLGPVGCSSPDNGTDEDPGGVTRTEVKIGFVAPLTGESAELGHGMKRAVELAFKEANASEDVRKAGYQFVLRAEDDQGDPEQAVNVANVLAGDPDVLGVIGHFHSECSIPASAIYDKHGIPMISVSTDPALTKNGYGVVNRIVARDDAQGEFAATLLADDFGFKAVAVVDDSTQYGRGLAGVFTEAFASKGGTIVARRTIQPGTVDFAALVTELEALAPQAVYYAGAHTEGGLISKQMSEAGLAIPLVGSGTLHSQEYVAAAGAANAEGDIATTLGLPLDQQPRGKDFEAAYRVEYGHGPQAYDSYAYDEAWIFVNAVLEVGAEREALVEAIRGGTFDGVTGLTEFDENGDTTNRAITWYTVKAGKWEQGVK